MGQIRGDWQVAVVLVAACSHNLDAHSCWDLRAARRNRTTSAWRLAALASSAFGTQIVSYVRKLCDCRKNAMTQLQSHANASQMELHHPCWCSPNIFKFHPIRKPCLEHVHTMFLWYSCHGLVLTREMNYVRSHLIFETNIRQIYYH